jgi:hypothetical protein
MGSTCSSSLPTKLTFHSLRSKDDFAANLETGNILTMGMCNLELKREPRKGSKATMFRDCNGLPLGMNADIKI